MRLIALFFVTMMPAIAVAETVYVDDLVNLGIRAEARSGEAPLKVVTTGMKLEVLAKDKNYLKVRAADGTEGWVNKFYTTDTPPARARIGDVETENSQLKSTLADNESTIEELRKKLSLLEQRLSAVTSDNQDLQERVSDYEAEEAVDENRWLYQSGGLILLFLLGVFLGIQWYKKRIGQRIGGLEF